MNTRQSGFNLIEVLVALVILYIGLMGIAAMQLGGVRGAQSSYYRSQATALMNDMAERMYVNRPGVVGGHYAAIDSNAVVCASASPAAQCAQETGGATAVSCSPANMADFDRIVVACGHKKAATTREGGVRDTLPGGRIQVTCIQTGGVCSDASQHTITVSWNERGDKNSAGESEILTHSVNMRVQP